MSKYLNCLNGGQPCRDGNWRIIRPAWLGESTVLGKEYKVERQTQMPGIASFGRRSGRRAREVPKRVTMPWRVRTRKKCLPNWLKVTPLKPQGWDPAHREVVHVLVVVVELIPTVLWNWMMNTGGQPHPPLVWARYNHQDKPTHSRCCNTYTCLQVHRREWSL